MTPPEVLQFIRELPATVTRVEIPGVLVIEQQPAAIIRAVPEVGDVERAAKAKEQRPPSDVESLGHTPPEWKD
jgi:hypothetical protein